MSDRREAAIEAAAKAMWETGREAGHPLGIVLPWDESRNTAGKDETRRIVTAAIDAYEQALAEQPREEREDDARHITWDHGRRTLCGQAVDGDPGDFYLPLGKAPRYDEGGAWCWSCLQLQDEAIGPAEQPRGEEEDAFQAMLKAQDTPMAERNWTDSSGEERGERGAEWTVAYSPLNGWFLVGVSNPPPAVSGRQEITVVPKGHLAGYREQARAMHDRIGTLEATLTAERHRTAEVERALAALVACFPIVDTGKMLTIAAAVDEARSALAAALGEQDD